MINSTKNRPVYLNRILPHIDKHVIKVLVGLRRSGKSFMMLNLMDYIRTKNSDANIVYLNKEHYEFDSIRNYHDLQSFFDAKYRIDKKNYFFVDEIQEIEEFEKCIRNIFSKKLADIYISGSNSEILSGDLASLLSGRFIEIRIHPLSYAEFLEFMNLPDSNESFYRYLKQGGMPGHINFKDENNIPVADYLKGVISTVLLKDVVKRYNIRNVSFLEKLVNFLSKNTGSLVSAKNISDILKSQRINISPNIVLNYISNICSAYFINKVSRIEIVGRKIFEIGDKYYFEDVGLRNTLVGYNPEDISILLENVVYNHLRIAGYTVYVGKQGLKEIDFFAEKDGEVIYVQVCYLLSGEKVMEREFGNLLAIADNYKKYVVSMDETPFPNTWKGIEHKHVIDFCRDIVL